MLHEFLSSNREELIRRCRAKVSQRAGPGASSSLEPQHGVPVFLGQLVETLREEESNPAHAGVGGSRAPPSVESRAALHGKELLQMGYTVDQVVHDYGDLCQAITELAKLKDAPLTIDEFQTLNRLLDNAIADAVCSYGQHHDWTASDEGAEDLHQRLGTLADEQRQLLDTALKALDALKAGNIGLRGATGTLLEDSLVKLRVLIDKSLPEIRLSSGMTTPPPGG